MGGAIGVVIEVAMNVFRCLLEKGFHAVNVFHVRRHEFAACFHVALGVFALLLCVLEVNSNLMGDSLSEQLDERFHRVFAQCFVGCRNRRT